MKKHSFVRIGILLAALLFAMAGTVSAKASSPVFQKDSLFTDRDLRQEPKLSKAMEYTLSDGQDITITEAGVYVLSGTASGATVFVDAGKDDKVQLVLNGISVTNADFPCIYVERADKVFVTVVADSSLAVTGAFRANGSRLPDGVIYARDDLVLNGTAALVISSSENGVVGKDDLKITGGTYSVTAASKCFVANDSIRVADGVFTLDAGTDAFHAKNGDDDSLGYIYIGGGAITINAGDDAIHGESVVQIDGGVLDITAWEGIEGTFIQVNGGQVKISAADDGINAAAKSRSYNPTLEINGGEIAIVIGRGDTDAVDSNGDIVINGGTVSVTGGSGFDYDGTGVVNGGTIIINGEPWTDPVLPNQFAGSWKTPGSDPDAP